MKANITKRDYQDWLRFCEQVQNTTNIPFKEAATSKDARKEACLKDYNLFVKTYFPIYADSDCGYFHTKAANHITKEKNCFAILEWPREHAKSVHANIMIPMWLMAKGELTGMILMGKNEDDACNLLADIQAQLQFNQLYAHDWGDSYNIGSWENGDFSTKSGIRFKAIGRDQSPRGTRKSEKRPNYAVIDDIDDDIIVNNQRRVLQIVDRILGALFFALSTKGAKLVVAGNRIHPQSILAHLVGDIKPGIPKREGIYHSKVYATEKRPGVKAKIGEPKARPAWKERYTLKEIGDKLATAGPTIGNREFYHEYTVEGKIFKDKYFQWKEMPKKHWNKYKIIIGYFDPSFENKPTSDFKAVRVWGLKTFEGAINYEKHLLDCFVDRCDLGEVYKWMSDFELQLPPGVGVLWYIENQFFNRPIRDSLARHNGKLRLTQPKLRLIPDLRSKENKFVRIIKMESEYYDGNVYFNSEKFHSRHMIEGNNQLKEIEHGYKTPDDAPDADEGAWYYIDHHLPSSSFTPRIQKKTNKSLY